MKRVPSFDAERFRRLAGARRITLGQPLSVLAVTESTNDLAIAEARRGAPQGALFVADEQTAGRGRRGSRWSSAAGENLTFSVLLRPSLAPENVSPLTLLIGLAVRDAAQRRTANELGVKWPNDVVAGRRKLAGILVESQLQGALLASVVIGVGLNVATREFPPELRDSATSLALLEATDLEREALLVDVLEEIEVRVRVYERDGLVATLEELRRHDALLAQRISVDGVPGVGCGLDDSGALLVDDGSGPKRIVAGHVTFAS